MQFGADNLPDDPVLLKQMLLLAHGKLVQLQEEVALLRHKLFSPRSECSPEDADSPQLAMFNEVEEQFELALDRPLARVRRFAVDGSGGRPFGQLTCPQF